MGSQQTRLPMKYSPEIDGLRTIAVFSVILYHARITVAGWPLLPGGYLGVDIFFVISGYLITTLLMRELERTGRISVLHFYERRVRRLLPALLAVMLVSLPVAWHYLPPPQLVDFSKSLIFSLLFSSNFYWYFSLQQYGAESALLQPFLHTWSLAVEEQYYIVFPLLLFAIHRWARRYLASILTIALLASLLFAEWATQRNASFSFYMLPTRFWELLAGSLAALLAAGNVAVTSNAMWQKAMPTLGLVLIVVPLFSLGLEAHHPGFVTTLPVLGTALVILFKRDTDWVTRVLSRPAMVYLGLLSYSLYLWHYPIFAFGRMAQTEPSVLSKCLWMVLTLVLSALSYYLLEKPFRSPRVSRTLLFTAVSLASVALLLVSLYWIVRLGLPGRGGYLADLVRSAEHRVVMQGGRDCHSGRHGGRLFGVSESCVFSYAPGASTLVLVGDSHAGVLGETVRALAEENDLNYAQITQDGCTHTGDYSDSLDYPDNDCRKRTSDVGPFLRQLDKPIIIYSARLPRLLEQGEFDNQEGDGGSDLAKGIEVLGSQEKQQRVNGIVDTLSAWLEEGYQLVIVYPVPEQGFHVSMRLFGHDRVIASAADVPTLSTRYDLFQKRAASSYAALDRVTGPGVKRVYPEKLFCSRESGRCVAAEAGRLYFYSDNHVSPLGADMLIREVAVELGLQVPDSFSR